MIVELRYLRGNLTDLPPFQIIFGVQYVSILLLKSPQPGVGIEGGLKMSLPAFVPNLGQISDDDERERERGPVSELVGVISSLVSRKFQPNPKISLTSNH